MEEFIAYISKHAVIIAERLIGALLVIGVGFWLVKRLVSLMKRGGLWQRMDGGAARFIATALSAVLKGLVLFTAATIVGVPAASIVTLIGSMGLAVGLALQGSLSNLAGGVLIVLFKPFRAGDYIETASGESGTVEEIGLFYTRLLMMDNRVSVIPNGSLSNGSIKNYSAKPERRVDMAFTASYAADSERVKAILRAAAAAHPLVLADREVFARMTAMRDSALEFTLRVWTKGSDCLAVRADLVEAVKRAFDEQGIEIPFPQLDVHLAEPPAGKRA